MIVTTTTGAYDDSREYTAWELAGDWWWCDLRYTAVVANGTAQYDEATANQGQKVRLSRLEITATGLRQINRYVAPDTRMRLVSARERAALATMEAEETRG